MKKEMLFLVALTCICFCSTIQATTDIMAGNGNNPAIKKEPLKARISLSNDNIERIIANDPRPIYLTVAPSIAVNTIWPDSEKSATVSKSDTEENESKTEIESNKSSQEPWTEADQLTLNGLYYSLHRVEQGERITVFGIEPKPSYQSLKSKIYALEAKRGGRNVNFRDDNYEEGQEIKALKLRLFLSKPITGHFLGKGPNKNWEDYNKQWEDYNELFGKIKELENREMLRHLKHKHIVSELNLLYTKLSTYCLPLIRMGQKIGSDLYYCWLIREINKLEAELSDMNVTISTSSPNRTGPIQSSGPQRSAGPTPASAVKLRPTPRAKPTPQAIMRPWKSIRS